MSACFLRFDRQRRLQKPVDSPSPFSRALAQVSFSGKQANCGEKSNCLETSVLWRDSQASPTLIGLTSVASKPLHLSPTSFLRQQWQWRGPPRIHFS